MLNKNNKLLTVLILVSWFSILFIIFAIKCTPVAEQPEEAPTSTTIFTQTTFYPGSQPHSSEAIIEELKNTPVLFTEIDYIVNYDIASTEEFLGRVHNSISELEALITSEEYNKEAIDIMSEELSRLQDVADRLAFDLEHYKTWEEEHYYATKVWEFLRQRGFNQEITCAIIGNMMIETSGMSLNLKPNIYDKSGSFYGLCQWSQKYYPDTKDLPFEQQLDYLLGNIQWEFDTFGKYYKEGFKYEDFLAMTDASEAALAFAMSYERCRPVSYEMRQEAALKAYEYFNLEAPVS